VLSRRTRAAVESRRGELSQVHHVAEVLQMLAWVDLFEGRPSASLLGSIEAGRVLAPAVEFNRASVFENALGQVEALRRLGRFAEARAALDGALAQAAEQHTDLETGLAHARGLQVGLLLDLGLTPADAPDVAAANLAIEVAGLGGENPDLATTQLALGRAALARGHRAEGLAALESAVKSSEHRPGDPFAIAEARFFLAQALAGEPSTAERARSLAQSARTALAGLPEPGPLASQVERWLATRR
jgi:tetratricopeptide (TPR) repeat protein